MDYTKLEQRAEELLEHRGISGHRAASRFVEDFKAYLIRYDAVGIGSAEQTMRLLESDEHLTDSSILYTNFRSTLDDLVSDALIQDPIFSRMFNILLDNNGKGVGAGELALPLVLSNYRFSNDSDGVLDGDKKVEIKKNGASLKPVKTGLTEKGWIDVLNKKYWNGTVPGKKSAKLFEAHLKTVKDPQDYARYFEELYVGCDTKELAQEVMGCYSNSMKFNTALGRFALKEYQRVDGWNNIIYIDGDSRKVVNIYDTSDIDDLGLKFSPVMRRGKDTQAIADGYVNVSI